MKNKSVFLLKIMLMTPLIWLLLMYSSQISVADDEIIIPKIKLSKSEIDLCNPSQYEKEFVLTIDLGREIKRSDSLISLDIYVAFEKKKAVLKDALTSGTLCEQIASAEWTVKRIFEQDIQKYSYYNFQCASITRPTSGNLPLIRFSGEYLDDNLDDSAGFFIDAIEFNPEFKLNYYGARSDTVFLHTVIKNQPEKTISLKPELDTFLIKKVGNEAKINYSLLTVDKKYLTNFDVEFELNPESLNKLEITDFNINEKFNYQIIESDKSKIKVNVQIKEAIEFSENEEFGSLTVKRLKPEAAEYTVKSNISNINDKSCSMNTVEQNTFLICDKDVSINDNEDEDIQLSYIGDKKIILNGLDEMIEVGIYDLFGREVDNCAKNNLYSSTVEIDLSLQNRGIYFVRLKFANKIKNIKLTIN